MILEILSRIGLVKDQKLKNGRWGKGEQYAREIYFYRNRYEDLFEISFSIFLFLKTDLQRVNEKVNTAINKIIGI
jgi:hypothetical protein